MLNKSLTLTIIAALFITVFISFLLPIHRYADTDLLWHIKQGQIIYETQSLMQHDPFIYPQVTDLHREKTILNNSWLTDLIFYITYKNSGFTGLVILKAILLSIMLSTLFFIMYKKHFNLALLSTLVLSQFFMPAEIRPTLLGYLFIVFLILSWEAYRTSYQIKHRILLWGVMLLWCNLHGSYIVGIGVLFVYLGTDYLKFIFFRHAADTLPHLIQNSLTVLGAFIITLFSPVGISPFIEIYTMNVSTQNQMVKYLISESRPLLDFLPSMNTTLLTLSVVVFLFIISFIVINHFRKWAKLSEIMAIIALFVLSMIKYRVFGFFILASLTIISLKVKINYQPTIKPIYTTITQLLTIIALCTLSYYKFPRTSLSNLYEANNYPLQATQFLAKNHINGHMLNDPQVGNYMLFKLYPEYHVFTDTRYLNLESLFTGYALFGAYPQPQPNEPSTLDYVTTILPALQMINHEPSNSKPEYWQDLMQQHNINFVVGRVTYPDNGLVRPLFLKLISQPNWHLIYADGHNVILIKEDGQNEALRHKVKPLSKKTLYAQILFENKNNHQQLSYESMAFAWLMLGNLDKSKQLAEVVLKTQSGLIAEACLQYIQQHSTQQKK